MWLANGKCCESDALVMRQGKKLCIHITPHQRPLKGLSPRLLAVFSRDIFGIGAERFCERHVWERMTIMDTHTRVVRSLYRLTPARFDRSVVQATFHFSLS